MMLSEKQIDRMLSKLRKFEEVLNPRMFIKKDEVTMQMFPTKEAYDDIPDEENFTECIKGQRWGGESSYCWFKGSYPVKDELVGKKLYIYPKIEGYEAMLWVNGAPFGTFCTKIVVTGHGNHYCDMLVPVAKEHETINIALEYYAGHYVVGCDPWTKDPMKSFDYGFESVDICLKDEVICDFYFDLKTLNQLVSCMDRNSFRRADVIKTLVKVHEIIYYAPDDVSEEVFYDAIIKAAPLLKEQLCKGNSSTVPFAGLIGHSHMDTAWLWHIGETIKKCARTYANELSLMEQYPEYTFIQSSTYHGEMIRKHYPELFERIVKKVAEGKYEPNGGVFIECDCNITSGESMVRQFLWGQRFTRKYFNYTSNSFWLPDTFGYSASIPQIMKGCQVDYFLTTKMAWNDTTEFPYDTFYWKGIDGTKVLTHLNKTHIWPDAGTLMDFVVKGNDSIKEKTVSDKRLLSYGFGDGGGGPQFEMIEMARRVKDLEGIPKSEHLLVGDFMKQLEATIEKPSVHNGELYLELHRGTLTNQHTIKRNNRLGEKKLHDLEYLTVRKAVEEGAVADGTLITPLMETLLVNQFHDILPGTCIPRAHRESIEQTTDMIYKASAMIHELVTNDKQKINTKLITNTLGFDRGDILYLSDMDGYYLEGDFKQQRISNLKGESMLSVSGLHIPALSSVAVNLVEGEPKSNTLFIRKDNVLHTPWAMITFNDKMFIESFYDLQEQRELRGEGYALNTFLIAEDMPNYWDSWDIDADIELKFKDSATLLSSEVISEGAVEYRIRNHYQLSEKSSVIQDMVFYADRIQARFETQMDWQDDHKFLKTAFDVSIHTDFARQEIQFGYLRRSTSRNTKAEKARFKVCNHKYTDLSENRYGIAILNDCKYGVSVQDSTIRLSLHKGGCRPDYHGDKGIHECMYAFSPHQEGFSAKTVINPAYEFNYPVIVSRGEKEKESFLSVNQENIIIETIKPCEDEQNAFIVRLYEAEGTYTNTILEFPKLIKAAYVTNMLEDVIEELPLEEMRLTFRAFEIKTIKLVYAMP